MSQPTSPSIPAFYRIFFTYVDPIICAWGAIMDFFMPTTVLSSHIPSPTPDIGHVMILKQRGGGMLNFGIISADMNVWRIVQLSCFVVDLAYYWAVWEVLAKQKRLDMGTWRAEDWGSIGITAFAGLVRLAFLARVEFGEAKNKEGKKNL
ncbi:unnamed protein product [Alternaria alternata]